MVARNKLKNLNIEPLSVAKYFYEKGIEDYRLAQDFLYLTYLEVLKKENKVLFQEKFEAWKSGPILASVFQKMHYYYKKHKSFTGLFSKIENVEEKTIRSLLAKVYRNYKNSKKNGQEIEFFFQVQDEPWEQAREQANGERRPHIFLEPTKIVSLAN